MNIFRRLLNLIFAKFTKTPGQTVGKTGAQLNNVDERDIKLASFTPARSPLNKFITDLSSIDVEDQKDKASCVGQAEGTTVKFYIYKTLGKIIPISRRFLYAMSKRKDGNLAHGTIPRVTALVIVKDGAATTNTVVDNNDLSYEDYIDVRPTGAVLDDAAKNKLPGVAFIDWEVNQICQAIEDHGTITATLAVDLSKWYVALLSKLSVIDAYHRVVFYGHELINGRRKIYFRNSWGKFWGNAGNGEFWFDDYKNNGYDVQVYTEIPKDLLEKAQSLEFIFDLKKPLEYKDEGYLVYKMQQRLQKEGYLKNVDISNIEPYFGILTATALLQYQIDNHIDSINVLQDLGGLYFGPKTMSFMNLQKKGEPKRNFIIAWANAIQSFEGWYVGSRSYRNNNPGNLRYSSLQIGMDGGFAFFKDYDTGFLALRTLLINAATGKSTIYNPNMTLLDFYNKYAPSSDGNYPHAYAAYVAKKMDVGMDEKIGTFV